LNADHQLIGEDSLNPRFFDLGQAPKPLLQLKQIDLENIGSLGDVGSFENRVPVQLTIGRYINIAHRVIGILEKPGIQGSLRAENDSGNRGTDN
jgi:hypothetical protein